jgi:hypothetical protein
MSGPSREGRGAISADRPPLPGPDDIARLLSVANIAKDYLELYEVGADSCEAQMYMRGKLKAAVERLHDE